MTPVAHERRRQRGAALLLALLTVALIATFSAAAYWRQWQAAAVERAQRQRAQADWILTGALDWARLILREDARASTTDHLAEPWAVPLNEARLSSFLAVDQADDPMLSAFLSGQIQDEQGKLNARNLVDGTGQQARLSAPDVESFDKLFHALGLPAREREALQVALLKALNPADDGSDGFAPVAPQRFEQLVWLGLSPATLRALAPHVTWLPQRTTLNLNTASAWALYAAIPGLDLAQAQSLVTLRQHSQFHTIDAVRDAFPSTAGQLTSQRHSVSSRYFLVEGRLRLDDTRLVQRSLIERDGTRVGIIWTDRQGMPARVTQPLQ